MKKKIIFLIAVVLIISISATLFISCKKEANGDKNLSYSTTFSTVPNSANDSNNWKEGMVGGNGHIGFITSGSPYNDTISNQNIDFLFPTERNRNELEDLHDNLDDVRQSIINFEIPNLTSTPWNNSYKYHPGHRIRIEQTEKELIEGSYRRWTNYQTAEVGVNYKDENGSWERKTFTSRVDNVTITSITQSEKTKINLTLSIDDLNNMYNWGKDGDNANGFADEKNMLFREMTNSDGDYIALVGHYPDYEYSNLKKGGYAGVTYIITVGGSKEVIEENNSTISQNVGNDISIKIKNADEVYLITALDRTENMCEIDEFESQSEYTLLNDLIAQCIKVKETYTKDGKFSYKDALSLSAKLHSEQYNAASIKIGKDTDDKFLSNDDILTAQRNPTMKTLSNAMMEKIYNQGRYSMICCGGYTMSRLCGMWSDNWASPWRSIYTMDANVNLQTSGMNTANLSVFGDGYINFIYKQIDDWKYNAKQIYGFEDAIQAPVNTDGDRAINGEYFNDYPFQYWNAGAAWMIQPIYEYYQCFGNKTIKLNDGEKTVCDILQELLELNANFWLQLCSPEYYTDKDGNAKYEAGKKELTADEKYLIIPSYSPENTTGGSKYKFTLAANAAMDIAAAKDSLTMAIDIENKTQKQGYEARIEKYKNLLNKLPNYQYDKSGALKEWCANGYEDNNNHRHISHLYPAWPAFETEGNQELIKATEQALKNRDKNTKAGEATQTHGWLHRALVGARIKNGQYVEEGLYTICHRRTHYNSFMTDHNTNRGSNAYCTDAEFGLIGVIDEALLFSTTGIIEVLPAIPSTWTEGKFENLRARTNAQVSCEWSGKKAKITIKSDIDQTITIKYGNKSKTISIKAGESKKITLKK